LGYAYLFHSHTSMHASFFIFFPELRHGEKSHCRIVFSPAFSVLLLHPF
jgi:hypothetical protein